jgi:hypothetical protein
MPKPPATKKAAKKKLQQKPDAGSDDDSNKASPEEKVCDDLLILLRLDIDIVTKVDQQRLKGTTKDLRICGKDGKGSHPVKNTSVEGWYCKFCL